MTSMLFSERMRSVAGAGAAAVIIGHLRALADTNEGAGSLARCPSPSPYVPFAPTLRRLVARLGAGRPRLVLGDVVLRRRLQQRTHAVLHGRNPIGSLHPLAAVPPLHIGRPMAVVVGAAHAADRRAEAFEAQFLPARGADVHRLEAATDILARHHLLAAELLRVADRFGDQHGVINPAIVEILADLVLRGLTLALVDQILPDVLDRRIVVADAVEVEAEIALGFRTRRPRVVFIA